MDILGVSVFEGVGIAGIIGLVLAYLLAFAVKGVFGYGAVPPMVLMGSLLMPPHQAVIVAGLVNFTSQWLLLPEGLRTGDRRIAGRMIVYILFALVLGVVLFRALSPEGLQLSVGLLLLAILLLESSSLRPQIELVATRNETVFSAVASLVAGLMAGIVGAGAMIFLSVYLRTLLPEKAAFRGTIILIVTSFLVVRTILLGAFGMIGWAEIIIATLLLPTSAVGLRIGQVLANSLTNDAFFRAYRWFMISAALLLVLRGLI